MSEENSPPPPGFDPRTVQSVASSYTDWGIPAHASKENTATFFRYGCLILKMKAPCFFETSVNIYQSKRHNTLQNNQDHHQNRCVNLKSHKINVTVVSGRWGPYRSGFVHLVDIQACSIFVVYLPDTHCTLDHKASNSRLLTAVWKKSI